MRSSARASSRRRCASALPELEHLDDPRWLARRPTTSRAPTWSRRRSALVALRAVGLRRSPQALVERGIVIEKAGVNTITLITTFQLGPTARSRRRSRALGDDPRPGASCPAARAGRPPANPFRGDRRPAGDASLRRAPLRQVDRPARCRSREAVGQRRGRGGRGLPARHPADPRGLPRQRRRRRYLLRGARRGRRRSWRATRRWRRCACSEARCDVVRARRCRSAASPCR